MVRELTRGFIVVSGVLLGFCACDPEDWEEWLEEQEEAGKEKDEGEEAQESGSGSSENEHEQFEISPSAVVEDSKRGRKDKKDMLYLSDSLASKAVIIHADGEKSWYTYPTIKEDFNIVAEGLVHAHTYQDYYQNSRHGEDVFDQGFEETHCGVSNVILFVQTWPKLYMWEYGEEGSYLYDCKRYQQNGFLSYRKAQELQRRQERRREARSRLIKPVLTS